METYVILRRDGWRTGKSWSGRSPLDRRGRADARRHPLDPQLRARGARRPLGTVCIYQASSPEAIRAPRRTPPACRSTESSPSRTPSSSGPIPCRQQPRARGRRHACAKSSPHRSSRSWVPLQAAVPFASGGPARQAGAFDHAGDARDAEGAGTVHRRGRGSPRRNTHTSLEPRESGRLQITHADDPGHGLPLPEPEDHRVRRPNKPPILVYEQARHVAARRARVGVHPEAGDAAAAGAKYGSFPAAATTWTAPSSQASAGRLREDEPESGAAFNFWHPDLVTLHVWIWYPNPDGLYASMNPLVRPFNDAT